LFIRRRIPQRPCTTASARSRFGLIGLDLNGSHASLAEPAKEVRPARGTAMVGGRYLPRMLASGPVDLERLEPALRERLDALGRAPRAELLHVLNAPRLRASRRIGEFWSYPESRAFAELLIDCEKDRILRAVLVGILRDAVRDPVGPG
jgi:hypothetical protein